MDGTTSFPNDPQLIPITPQSGLFLTFYGQGDEARFARIFRETWASIPQGDRRFLQNHWRNDPFRSTPLPASPHIALLTEVIITIKIFLDMDSHNQGGS